jgi:hypothetical protein
MRNCFKNYEAMESWLWLIPVFGLVWQFIVVVNIAKSLGNEFVETRNPMPGIGPGTGCRTGGVCQ